MIEALRSMTLLSDSMPRMKPFRKPIRFGNEEGEICGRRGCKGTMVFPNPENCSCHIRPPCYECENLKLRCTECGWEHE